MNRPSYRVIGKCFSRKILTSLLMTCLGIFSTSVILNFKSKNVLHTSLKEEVIAIYQNQNRLLENEDLFSPNPFFNHSIIQKQRENIIVELEDPEFVGNSKNITLDGGRKPKVSMIVASWRGGSTFLGDIINSQPGTFYHYEPFMYLGVKRFRYGDIVHKVLKEIKDLFTCNYSGLGEMINFVDKSPDVFSHNQRMVKYCKNNWNLCRDLDFIAQSCRLYPFQTMKVNRLSLNITEPLIKDEDLDLRLVYLVRDPRGTVQSRKSRPWCKEGKDCHDSEVLCSDLERDFFAAKELTLKYPQKIFVIRYEDLALEPEEVTKKLMEFLGYQFHPNIKQFLESHTKISKGGAASTFRDSKKSLSQWKEKMKFSEILQIQNKCMNAMNLWGYHIYGGKTDLTKPAITNYSLHH